MTMRRYVFGLLLMLSSATPAWAHSASRGFVLLLPTSWVILAGALAVLISFLAVSVLPNRLFKVPKVETSGLAPSGSKYRHILSLLSAAAFLLLIWIGIAGPRDPLENLLHLTIWTLWWVVIVLLHPAFGNLWRWLNPFSGPYAVLTWLTGGWLHRARLNLPATASYLPAILIFLAFAWFQLVDPRASDPARLAVVVSVYAGLTMLAVCLFGPDAWLSRADPFAVFLTQLGCVSPFGAGLASLPALPLSGTLFVLLTLSSISFDSFSNTFTWLSSLGVNPLDYPGRTALMAANTLGLLGAFVTLAGAYLMTTTVAWFWAGQAGALHDHLGRLVYSLIPISIAFHFAHYLGDTLVNLQYFVLALNDPLGSGATRLGLPTFEVTASFQNTAAGALTIFSIQSLAVVIGHIAGVAVAHAITLQMQLPQQLARRLEAPLALLMVAYTVYGLWLLSTPAIS